MPQILWELSLEQMAPRMLSMEVTQQSQWRKKLASGSEETLNPEPWRQLLNWITVLSASLSLISFRVAKQESLSIWSFQKALRSQPWKCSISQRLPSRSSTMSTRMFFQSMYLLLSTLHLALPLYWKSDSRMSSRPSEKWLAPTIQRSQSTSDQTQSGNTFLSSLFFPIEQSSALTELKTQCTVPTCLKMEQSSANTFSTFSRAINDSYSCLLLYYFQTIYSS